VSVKYISHITYDFSTYSSGKLGDQRTVLQGAYLVRSVPGPLVSNYGNANFFLLFIPRDPEYPNIFAILGRLNKYVPGLCDLKSSKLNPQVILRGAGKDVRDNPELLGSKEAPAPAQLETEVIPPGIVPCYLETGSSTIHKEPVRHQNQIEQI